MFEEKKTIITKVAQKIFSKYGFFKTTLDDIAKAARIGKASIYHYFRSKEELFEIIVDTEYRLLIKQIEADIKIENTPMAKLKTYIYSRIKYLKDLANLHSTLVDDYLEHYAFTEKLRERYFNKEMDMLKCILKKGVEENVFEIDDIHLTTFAIVTALKGLEYPWTFNVPMPDIEENIEKLCNILSNGIIKRS